MKYIELLVSGTESLYRNRDDIFLEGSSFGVFAKPKLKIAKPTKEELVEKILFVFIMVCLVLLLFVFCNFVK